MADVTCRRCGQHKSALDDAPLPGEVGQAVLAQTCADCWREWSEEQTRLINHLGLRPFVPADKKVIYQHLQEFLKLQGVTASE
jgi:Fe-S cluster biosynthesis and repair protein YggX